MSLIQRFHDSSTVEPVVECKGRSYGEEVVGGDVVGGGDGMEEGGGEGEEGESTHHQQVGRQQLWRTLHYITLV